MIDNQLTFLYIILELRWGGPSTLHRGRALYRACGLDTGLVYIHSAECNIHQHVQKNLSYYSIGLMKGHDIRISMDGNGSWRDNVFVEHLWRSVKYEDFYLRAHDSVSAVRSELNRYFNFYNSRRLHLSLDGRTPDQVYFSALPRTQEA